MMITSTTSPQERKSTTKFSEEVNCYNPKYHFSRKFERLIFLFILLTFYTVNNLQWTGFNINIYGDIPPSSADPVPPMETVADNGSTQRELELKATAAKQSPALEEVSVVGSKSKQDANSTGNKRVQDRLVVRLSKEHLYFHYGQERLCKALQDMTLTEVHEGYFEKPDHFRDPIPGRPTPRLEITLNCKTIIGYWDFGEGNWVSAAYSARMAAARAKVDYSFKCREKNRNPLKLLLPWLEVEQKAPTMEDPWPFIGPIPTAEEVCNQRYSNVRLDKIADQIMDDARRMAVTLVGSQKDGIRQHPAVPIDQPPMVPDVVLDDVVIHFRCGDIMGGGERTDYGMIKFTEYLKHINKNETKSIGILTQPFDANKVRRQDRHNVESCKSATYLLVKTLQNFVPAATVTIHNGPTETIPLVWARLVMAKQAFTSLSSLTIFPVIGTFGKGYFQKGNEGVNPFNVHLPAKFSHLTMMKGAVLSQKKISKRTMNQTLDWFVTPE